MQEKWKHLVYPKLKEELNHFSISTYGRLRNDLTGNILKPSALKSGYYSVRTTLGKRNNKMHIIIHKAVAYTFIPNENNFPEVNHKDGDKLNNYVNNLEWCTSSYNQQHKYDIGLFDKSKLSGENNKSVKLTWNDIEYIREHYAPYSKQYGSRALARRFNISHTVILDIINNKSWKCSES